MVYWKSAINWLVTQVHVMVIVAACRVIATDSSEPTREIRYLPRGLRGLGMADSWFNTKQETPEDKLLPQSSSSGGYFNLRLYWEKGYNWQDKSSEKFWCIECTRSSCSKGSGIRIDNCSRNDSRQQFYFDDGRIRSRKNKSVCFERKGRQIKLDSCSSSKSQKWDELSKSKAFQLRIPGNSVYCASQHHHPKDGEDVYMTSCKKSRSNKTDKWIAY